MSIRVLIVDAQTLLSGALAEALTARGGFEAIHVPASTGAAALEIAEVQKPDVCVVDGSLQDMEGAALARMLRARLPDCKVVMVSGFYNPRQIEDALAAGAVGFLPKTAEFDELVDAIRQAHAGVVPVAAERLASLRRALERRLQVSEQVQSQLATLTPREVQVLTLLNIGRSTEQIAEELDIAVKTVANHIQNILEKTATSSRAEALALARSTGFVRPLPYNWQRITPECRAE